MLLEKLVEKAAQPAEYDWESYYRWLFGSLAGREVAEYRVWLCRQCHTVNLLFLPARYGACRRCRVVCMPSNVPESKSHE